MSRTVASIIAKQLRAKPPSVLGLATGSTPLGTYKELVRMHKEEGLDFSQVRTFNLDEYFRLDLPCDRGGRNRGNPRCCGLGDQAPRSA